MEKATRTKVWSKKGRFWPERRSYELNRERQDGIKRREWLLRGWQAIRIWIACDKQIGSGGRKLV